LLLLGLTEFAQSLISNSISPNYAIVTFGGAIGTIGGILQLQMTVRVLPKTTTTLTLLVLLLLTLPTLLLSSSSRPSSPFFVSRAALET